ncbi:MAG: hypothetical protein P8X62_12160, partial [Flavobacteriaceae bacterium]
MKTKTISTRIIISSFLMFYVINISAQDDKSSKSVFVRVYELNGKKTEKGHISFINDTLLVLNKKNKVAKLSVSKIGKIKTKRSTGHNVLVGSAIGGTTLAAVGALTANEETKTKTIDGGWLFGQYQYEVTTGHSSGEGAIYGGLAG